MSSCTSLLADIAREYLHIPTLETRRSDQLDFHDVAVWQVAAALKAAFDAGVQCASMEAAAPNRHPVGPTLQSPLFIPKGTPLVPGKMYLRLYHGRTDPTQEMDDWGFTGPTFGPLACYVHTYCCTFRIHAESGNEDVWLNVHDDMIQWDGCFYGDLEVFVAGADEKA